MMPLDLDLEQFGTVVAGVERSVVRSLKLRVKWIAGIRNRSVIAEYKPRVLARSQIEQKVRAFTRREQQRGDRYRAGQEAAIGTDHMVSEFSVRVIIRREREIEEPSVGPVHQSQTVNARSELEHWPDLPVYHRVFPNEFRCNFWSGLHTIDGLLVVKLLAVVAEALVLQHEWDFKLSRRQHCRFLRITDQIQTEQPRVDVQTGDV